MALCRLVPIIPAASSHEAPTPNIYRVDGRRPALLSALCRQICIPEPLELVYSCFSLLLGDSQLDVEDLLGSCGPGLSQ